MRCKMISMVFMTAVIVQASPDRAIEFNPLIIRPVSKLHGRAGCLITDTRGLGKSANTRIPTTEYLGKNFFELSDYDIICRSSSQRPSLIEEYEFDEIDDSIFLIQTVILKYNAEDRLVSEEFIEGDVECTYLLNLEYNNNAQVTCYTFIEDALLYGGVHAKDMEIWEYQFYGNDSISIDETTRYYEDDILLDEIASGGGKITWVLDSVGRIDTIFLNQWHYQDTVEEVINYDWLTDDLPSLISFVFSDSSLGGIHTNYNSKHTFSYYPNGKLASTTKSVGSYNYVSSYTYNLDGTIRQIDLDFPSWDGTDYFQYDLDGRLRRIVDNQDHIKYICKYDDELSALSLARDMSGDVSRKNVLHQTLLKKRGFPGVARSIYYQPNGRRARSLEKPDVNAAQGIYIRQCEPR